MLERGQGWVVTVNSPAGYTARPGAVGYGAARQAVRGFTEALAADLRGTGIGVTAVVAGHVDSEYFPQPRLARADARHRQSRASPEPTRCRRGDLPRRRARAVLGRRAVRSAFTAGAVQSRTGSRRASRHGRDCPAGCPSLWLAVAESDRHRFASPSHMSMTPHHPYRARSIRSRSRPRANGGTTHCWTWDSRASAMCTRCHARRATMNGRGSLRRQRTHCDNSGLGAPASFPAAQKDAAPNVRLAAGPSLLACCASVPRAHSGTRSCGSGPSPGQSHGDPYRRSVLARWWESKSSCWHRQRAVSRRCAA